MNQNALSCPTQTQLTAFAAGRLDITDSVEIEQHLASCDSCCQLLKVLPSEDTLVCLLRDPKVETASDGGRLAPLPGPATALPPAGQPATLPPGRDATEVSASGSAPVAFALPEPLRNHGRYWVTELIGRGGMGDVYKAHHRMMNRPVALKVINGQLVNSRAAVERFHREIQAAARLSHPNIVTAYDAEQAGDTHFLVMEFVEGTELASLVRQQGPLPVAQACDFVIQAAEALQHAHELGLVHRDIKPHNLMVTRRESRTSVQERGDIADAAGSQVSSLGTRPSIKILDFGLASFVAETAADENDEAIEDRPGVRTPSHLTTLGSLMGTPDYISPEQAQDAHSADIRSDIYSLGCTLYCLLAGEPPFASDSVREKVAAHIGRVPNPLCDYRDDIPPGLDDVLRRMMAKNPDDRFQTPGEVAIALASFTDNRLRMAAAGDLSDQPPRRRPRLGMFGAAALLLSGVIFVTTDKGQLEIRSDVDDVDVVVKQDGKEIKTIDLQTGSQVTWFSSGDYEISLKHSRNDIRIDRDGFQLARWGKQIVSVRLEPTPIDSLSDRDQLQGDWVAESGEQNGQPTPFEKIGIQRAVFDGDSLHVDMPGGVKGDGHFQLTESSDPKQIGIFVRGENKGMRGIYKLQGDRLILCMDLNPASELPTSFDAPAGTTRDLIVLRRDFQAMSSLDHSGELRRFVGHQGPIRDVVYAPDAKRFLSGSGYPYGDNTMRLWDANTGREIRKFTDDGMSWVLGVAISPDGRRALSASWDGLRLWDLETAEVLHHLVGHEKDMHVNSVVFSPDGKRALSASADKSLRLWDLDSGQQIRAFVGHTDMVTSVAFSPDGRSAISAAFTDDKSVRMWDVDSGDEIHRFEGHLDRVNRVIVSSDGARIVSAGGDGIRVWDIHSKQPIRHIASSRVQGLAFLDGENRVLSSSEDGTIVIWDLETGEAIEQLAQLSEIVWTVAVAPDRPVALTAGGSKIFNGHWERGSDFAVRLWRLPKSSLATTNVR